VGISIICFGFSSPVIVGFLTTRLFHTCSVQCTDRRSPDKRPSSWFFSRILFPNTVHIKFICCVAVVYYANFSVFFALSTASHQMFSTGRVRGGRQWLMNKHQTSDKLVLCIVTILLSYYTSIYYFTFRIKYVFDVCAVGYRGVCPRGGLF